MSLRALFQKALLLGALQFVPVDSFLEPLRAQEPAALEIKTGGLPIVKEGTKVTERTVLLRPVIAEVTGTSRLYPTAAERRPGNAAPIILRMNSEANTRRKTISDLEAKEYYKKSIEEMDAKEIEAAESVLFRSELRRAVFRQSAGWEYPVFESPHFFILLPDVQDTRFYSRAMNTFARGAILRNDLSRAEEWLLYANGLARHVSETPFAICRMVAAAEMNDAFNATAELIQHPKATNYYWDLTAIPAPTGLIHDAVQFETGGWVNTVSALKDLDAIETEAQWQKLVEEIQLNLHAMGDSSFEKKSDYLLLGADWVARSREQLPVVVPGTDASSSNMTAAEVSVRYWWNRTQHFTSLTEANLLLKPHQALKQLYSTNSSLDPIPDNEKIVKRGVGDLPQRMFVALTLLEQHLEMLRTIEAIRDWSAKHDGKLPKSLDELSLSIADDPLTGKPFEWSVTENGKEGVLKGVFPIENGKFFEKANEIGRIYHIRTE
jgi:hypothetical protein